LANLSESVSSQPVEGPAGDPAWRTAYLREAIELAAVRAGARRPSLFQRLVRVEELAGETPEALRLAAEAAVAAALERAPELRGVGGARGLQSAGGRGSLPEQKPDSDAWLRAAARRR
jgi:hypothetical protein